MSRKIIFGLLIALAFVPDRLPGAAAPVKIQRIGYLTANSSAVPIQNTSWQMAASNTDIGMTLAHILGLQIQRKGVLVGRVLREALKSDGSTQPVKKFQRLSSPSHFTRRRSEPRRSCVCRDRGEPLAMRKLKSATPASCWQMNFRK